jgi:putative sugar O-methyltransferase
LKDSNNKSLVELGAGIGQMAYFLLRYNEDLTYVDLDLPENAALTAYYLLKAFPSRNIRLFGEIDLENESIKAGSVLIMPSFEINHLATDSAGVVFNSYSLAEMSQDTIMTYITEFNRITCDRGYFMHINHNKNSLVVADNFGIDHTKFDLLYKIPALWNMGRNSKMDEYEYLYKKTGTRNNSN